MVAQKIRCVVRQIAHHGDHVYTVHLKPERTIPRFRAGQFLHLALDEYEPGGFWPESRVFSIASSPSTRESISISYSVRGRFTTRMESELKEGLRVWIKLPYGEFTIPGDSDIALFAGGTGITAFTAFLSGLNAEFPHRIYLAYGARSRNLLVYRETVAECAARMSRLTPFYFVEKTAEEKHAAAADDNVTEGILSAAVVWPALAEPQSTKYYLSGPPRMLADLSADLRDRGISRENIFVDAWE
jgi:ferredoxin-NADP reductase